MALSSPSSSPWASPYALTIVVARVVTPALGLFMAGDMLKQSLVTAKEVFTSVLL
ncbi:MAG: hypothetical protein J7L51_02645 [Desulfurococcales archaeon]|nr:hypothetical protein [Desulfurococcales archaeon]